MAANLFKEGLPLVQVLAPGGETKMAKQITASASNKNKALNDRTLSDRK